LGKVQILFLLPYSLGSAPSQRFRVEQYFSLLGCNNENFHVQTFYNEGDQGNIYKSGRFFKKSYTVILGFIKRLLFVLLRAYKYDYIFLHREASPIGPPLFEWVLARLMGKRLIYDFDDAIWIPNTSKENVLASWFRCTWKVKYICKWSYKVVAGNEYLSGYAQKYSNNILQIPTVVDTVKSFNKLKQNTASRPVIGWTGSHSTIPYVFTLLPVLQKLQLEIDFEFVVIADREPDLPLSNYRFIPWNPVTENEDLLSLDIGIMPLNIDSWSEGKCGFKLIQYFAAGLPAVASPVGVNKNIIDHGQSGYLCDSFSEWEQTLRKLLLDADLRKRMGREGRKKVEKYFSLVSQEEKFIDLFT
jgi:glycosyltransferase involved in cell wall biosynthesis